MITIGFLLSEGSPENDWKDRCLGGILSCLLFINLSKISSRGINDQ